MWQMYIRQSNAATICPASVVKTQSQRNLFENICSLKVFGTGRMMPDFLENRTLFWLNEKLNAR